MVHGNPSWSFYYRNLIAELASDHRVIAPDHVGCGLSDKPDDDRYEYRLARRVADLEALLDHLQVTENVTLVVHDWGGMIGFAYATRYPQRISRLVVLNTGAFRKPAGKSLPWQLWLARNTWLGAFMVRGLNAFARGTVRIGCCRRRMPKEIRDAYLAPYDSWANRIATLRFVQDIPLNPGDPSYDLVLETEQSLDRLKNCPMLICWGEKDFVFDHHFLDDWIRRFPDADVRRFPDAGHYVLEDAADEVVPAIAEFCRSSLPTG